MPQIEQLSARYLLLLRPRRIGKSVLLSLLERHDDLGPADQFDKHVGRTAKPCAPC